MFSIKKILSISVFITAMMLPAMTFVTSASAADNMGIIYQQPYNRFIVYGDFEMPSLILQEEVEILYFDRVIGVGFIQEAQQSYIIVKVIKFAVDVFLGDATSVRRVIRPQLETLKKTVNYDTPYDYDPYRMTVYPYVTSPDAKVKKIPKEVSTYKTQENKGAETEAVWESRRRNIRAGESETEKKEELKDGKPALKEKTTKSEEDKSSSSSSRRRRRAETDTSSEK